jgi:hypothetical protein
MRVAFAFKALRAAVHGFPVRGSSMHRQHRAMKTTFAILLLAAAGHAASAQASSTHVSRCSSDEGEAIYTDGSCLAVGGTPIPMSANLLRSLAREGALGSDSNFRPTGTPQRAGGSGSTRGPQLGGASCPRTPAELASRLRTSLGDGQVNRLASLYDWNGKSSQEAKPILAKLERMSERPLIDGQYFNDSLSGGGGTVQLVQGAHGAATVTEIPVQRRAGCLLLAL